MINCRNQFWLILISLTVQKNWANGCTAGWFGPDCKFPCHCEKSVECDAEGVCPTNDRCRSPYFGPGCQYIDLAVTSSHNSTPLYLRDNDEATCNPNASETRVEIILTHPVWARWFRIHTNDNITLFHRNFTTTIDHIPCNRLRMYRVNNTAMDLRCVSSINFMRIEFEGRVVPHICTINVSGGRNIAIHQSVNQSSNYSGDSIDQVKAENAVDGNTNGDYSAASCSRTQVESQEAYWFLILDNQYWIQKIVIYNSETYREWLSGFSVRTFNSFGMLNYRHIDHSSEIQLVYDIEVNIGEKANLLQITASKNIQGSAALSLCEVQVLGDAACAWMTHGLSCEQQCSCNMYSRCFRNTGACEYTQLYYCPPGKYGEYCNISCPENCQYDACDALTGRCLACVPGFRGEVCNIACRPGTFGLNCSLNCSSKCVHSCHHVNGVCICKDGFTGSLCTECPEGWYGLNCTHTCPTHCYQNRCDVRTGDCDACPEGRSGLSCADCQPSNYGTACQNNCPKTCSGRICDDLSGKCVSCIDRHTGPYCEECTTGWYGQECNETCSTACQHLVCDTTTGDCKSCVGNFTGPKCEGCPVGYYGSACNMLCTGQCQEGSCDRVDGSCHSCADGFSGKYCQQGGTSTNSPYLILTILIGVIAMTVCGFFLVVRNKQSGE